MALLKTEGIVLRTQNLGDADKVVTLLTRQKGKLRASARGARRVRSQLLAVSQPFAYGQYMVFINRNLHNLSQGQLTRPFRKLREDLTAMAYATYFSELADVGLPEEEPDETMFRLLLAAFTALEEETAPPALLARWFELQFLTDVGFQPELETCVNCRKAVEEDTGPTLQFNVAAGGYVCPSCAGQGGSTPLSRPAYQSIRFLLASTPAHLGRLQISGKDMDVVEKLMARYIEYRLERNLNSLAFLRSVNGMAP